MSKIEYLIRQCDVVTYLLVCNGLVDITLTSLTTFLAIIKLYELVKESCSKGYRYRYPLLQLSIGYLYRYRRYFGSEISISYRYRERRYGPTSIVCMRRRGHCRSADHSGVLCGRALSINAVLSSRQTPEIRHAHLVSNVWK